MKLKIVAVAALVALAGCSNTPTGRAVGGGLLGGAAGAGIAGIAGGDPATGALLGAGIGALGGALTAPQPQPRVNNYYYGGPPGRHRGW